MSASLFALEDLGAYGKAYEISEPDFFEILHDPSVQKRVVDAAKRVDGSIRENLRGHGSTGACLATATRHYEPVYVLDKDIVLPNGKVLYKKGYRFNILEKMGASGGRFGHAIMFVDADSPVQRAFVRKYAGEKTDVIVVRGDGETLRKEGYRIMVANDTIAKRFDLRCLPSYYIQDGNRFEIREYSEKWLTAKGVTP